MRKLLQYYHAADQRSTIHFAAISVDRSEPSLHLASTQWTGNFTSLLKRYVKQGAAQLITLAGGISSDILLGHK